MTSVAEVIVEKVKEAEFEEKEEVKICHLPQSALVVVKILRKEGALTPKDIFKKTKFAPRTVRYALKTLLENGIVDKVPNLLDLRQNKYKIIVDTN
ncbi:MAG: winged helix-turn-helix transcriptional regulator [Candidatus Lokiarchaeia archaeon]